MQLAGKVVFITGAAQGIGRGCSKALLKRGTKICLADINHEKGQITLEELQSEFGRDSTMFLKCDVGASDQQLRDSFNAAVQRFGKVDIMVNNAGMLHEKQWEKMIDVNLKGTIRGSLLAIEHMRKNTGGSGGVIINFSSGAGLNPSPYLPCYSASKFGITGFTRSWAKYSEHSQLGVRLVTICPGYVDTEILRTTNETILDVKLQEAAMANSAMLTVEEMSELFIDVVENEANNGAVVSVTKKHGAQYVSPV